MIIEDWQLYLGMILAGLFTGLGSAVGNYFAQTHFISNFKKINKKRKKLFTKK